MTTFSRLEFTSVILAFLQEKQRLETITTAAECIIQATQ
jgi:hypothetical protein